MRVLPPRDPGLSASAQDEFSRRATIEPMLPALIRDVAFLSALAMPFVAALLLRRAEAAHHDPAQRSGPAPAARSL